MNNTHNLFDEFQRRYPDSFYNVIADPDENERRKALKEYSQKMINFISAKIVPSAPTEDLNDTLNKILF